MKPPIEDRPKQETPEATVNELLLMIKGQFYDGQLAEDKFYKDRPFLKKRVVMHLASWLDRKGFTLPPERYREIFLHVLNDAKTFVGAKRDGTGTDRVIHNPTGFLMVCLQKHLKVNEDKYHDEAKGVTLQVQAALTKASAAPQIDQVATMAAAAALITPKRRVCTKPNSNGQVEFNLS
jgi:hypothetical protein